VKYAVLALCALVLATPSTAATFARTEKATNPKLAAVRAAFKPFQTEYTLVRLFKITKKNAPNGRTPSQVREATMKEALHRSSSGSFDEGISLRRVHVSDAGAAYAIGILEKGVDNPSLPWAAAKKALRAALDEQKLDVRVGGGNGADVMADILSIYDAANDELYFIAFSNEQLD
jgi:hypothetical protein